MRQIGTLSDAQSARAFGDYLQAKSIETRLEQVSEGWVVWVCDEDRVPLARQELQAFQQNPSDERYRTVAPPPEPAPEQPAVRRRVRNSGAWAAPPERQLTISLIVLSVLVTLLYHSPPQEQLVTDNLFITRVEVVNKTEFRWWTGEGQLSELREGQGWRAVTPIFIHFGPFHLLFNMLWLYGLGSQIEKRSGPLRLGLLVVLIAVISNLCQYWFSSVSLDFNTWELNARQSPAFGGMSGVVFGLFGYVWVRTLYQPNCGLAISMGNVVLMIAWLFICMTGEVGPIANTAHLVGLIVGMVAGYVSAWSQGSGQRELRDG